MPTRVLYRRYVPFLGALAVGLLIVFSTAQAWAPAFKYIRSFGTGNGMQVGPGQLSTPEGVAVEPTSGDVLVADSMNNRVQEFNPTGKFIRAVGSEGSNPGQFSDPDGIGVGLKGNIYVADANNGRVEEFTSSWKYIQSFGTFDNSPGPLAVAPKGDVYVTDGNLIRHFASNGVEYPSFGGGGTGDGQFVSTIGGLAVGPKGLVYASDYSGGRVEVFKAGGAFAGSIANRGPAAVVGPIGVAATKTAIFVSDNVPERVVQLKLNGSFARAFGNSGPGKLDNTGMAGSDCAGLVYVSDMDVGRVREFGNPKAPKKGCK